MRQGKYLIVDNKEIIRIGMVLEKIARKMYLLPNVLERGLGQD
jgi:hypothetical protein